MSEPRPLSRHALQRGVAALLTLLSAFLVLRYFPSTGKYSDFRTPLFLLCAGVSVLVCAGDDQDEQLGRAALGMAFLFAVMTYIQIRFFAR